MITHAAVSEVTLIPSAALWTAVLAAVGWLFAQYFTLWRDDRAKRLQFTIEHAEKQLTAFYAPLIALLEKLHTTAETKKHIVQSSQVNEESRTFFNEFIYYNYFSMQHAQIQEILSKNIHLLEGWAIPNSYHQYIRHFTSENIYNDLLYRQKKPFDFKVWDYPEDFIEDLKRGQNIVLKRYEDCLAEQRMPLLPAWFNGVSKTAGASDCGRADAMSVSRL